MVAYWWRSHDVIFILSILVYYFYTWSLFRSLTLSLARLASISSESDLESGYVRSSLRAIWPGPCPLYWGRLTFVFIVDFSCRAAVALGRNPRWWSHLLSRIEVDPALDREGREQVDHQSVLVWFSWGNPVLLIVIWSITGGGRPWGIAVLIYLVRMSIPSFKYIWTLESIFYLLLPRDRVWY